MAFRAIVFPIGISRGAKGGSGFSTETIVFGSGNESRNRNWTYNRGKWDVSHVARLPAVWQPLQAFFNVVGGKSDGFLFKDWFDYSALISEGVLLTIDGTHKQLAKRFTFGSITYDHPIYKPLASTITITGGGALDDTTGIVTGGTPTAWSGEFYKPARFDTDEMTGQWVDNSGSSMVVGWDPIPIIETRLEP